MRHATDADHIVAIATIVSRQRTMHGSMQIGAAWGVGHTITVMAVGSAIVLFGVVIPPWLGLSMELAVGLACPACRAHSDRHEPRRGRGPGGTVHGHGDYVHRHPHGHGPDDHDHAGDRT